VIDDSSQYKEASVNNHILESNKFQQHDNHGDSDRYVQNNSLGFRRCVALLSEEGYRRLLGRSSHKPPKSRQETAVCGVISDLVVLSEIKSQCTIEAIFLETVGRRYSAIRNWTVRQQKNNLCWWQGRVGYFLQGKIRKWNLSVDKFSSVFCVRLLTMISITAPTRKQYFSKAKITR
jgi:hypothetical protein